MKKDAPNDAKDYEEETNKFEKYFSESPGGTDIVKNNNNNEITEKRYEEKK